MRTSRILEGLEPYDPKALPARIRLAANENPLDVPVEVKDAVARRLADLAFNRYPDPCANGLRELIAANIGQMALPLAAPGSRSRSEMPALEAGNIVVGNGGDELLFNLFLAFGGPDGGVLTMPPGFSVYDIDAQLTGTPVVHVPRSADMRIDEQAVLDRLAVDSTISIVVITSPNNPTGDCAEGGFIRKVLEATDALVLVDEAYGEFAGRTCIPLVPEHGNLCVLRTFSKAYALAGVRLGYVVAQPGVVEKLLMVRQPYSVDAVSQAIGEEVCRHLDAFTAGIRGIVERRELLYRKLSNIKGVEVFPSCSNYLMVRVAGAQLVWETMVAEDGILVRNLTSQEGLSDCLRITVGTHEENEAVLDSLARNVMRGFVHAKR